MKNVVFFQKTRFFRFYLLSLLLKFTDMKRDFLKKAQRYLPFILLIISLLACTFAFGGVGNHDAFDSGGGSGGGDGFDIGVLIGYLIRLFIKSPVLGMIVVVIVIVGYYILKKRGASASVLNQQAQQLANTEVTPDYSASVAAQIQAIDPTFSADKFIGFAREVFMKINEAWTKKDWRPIRPFESEALFNMHKQQLDEYIRLGKTNVIEKISIKHCSLNAFQQDGDKEVLTVWINVLLRDYVIDDTTKKVLERDPNRDWYMRYVMIFNRKAGVKTDPGRQGNSITNCPNCGAPTEITSSGQCPYCGSVVTNGEHDWVLTEFKPRT